MLRSILAVFAGYAVFAVSAVALFALSGRDAHAPQDLTFTILSIAVGMVFAGLGGWIAARLAPRRALTHAGAVALVIAIGAAVSIPAVPEGTFPWSQIAALVAMAPSALLGGWFFARRVEDGGGRQPAS
jgi:hypothetical protein